MANDIRKGVCFLLILVLTGFCFSCSEEKALEQETYRSAKVLDLTGNALVIRSGEESTQMYEGMVLKPGDTVTTKEGQQVQIRLDSDKYIVIEENSVLRLELSGDTSDGSIRLYLEYGSVQHKIESSLSQKDSYEVHTDTAVMAVRGTEFTTIQTEEMETRVKVKSGKVEITLKNGEGSCILEAGEGCIILSSEEEETVLAYICPKCDQWSEEKRGHMLDCGNYGCLENSEHMYEVCGIHCICNQEFDSHLLGDCGHFLCEDVTHHPCELCGICLEFGLHGDGVCVNW